MTLGSTDSRRVNFGGRPWQCIRDAVLLPRLPYDGKYNFFEDIALYSWAYLD
jgi:hypothetical protein